MSAATTAKADSALDLLDQCLQLLPENRYKIAMELLASLEPTEEVLLAEKAALKAELTRRWQRMRSGEDVGIPAEEVLAELRRRAEERRNA